MNSKALDLYIDKDIKELNSNIYVLEERVIDLNEQKLEIEGQIYDFNNRYNEKVGPSLVKHLNKREEDIEKLIEKEGNEEKKQELEQKLQIAKEDTKDFHTHSKSNKQHINSLSQEEEKELKILYKKACKLCHPDMVDESFKEEALTIFHKLNTANQKKEIAVVRDILAYLQDNNFGLSADITDMEILKQKHSTLKSDILKLEIEMKDLKLDETYKKIQDITDWDRYFKAVSKQLEKEVHKQEV